MASELDAAHFAYQKAAEKLAARKLHYIEALGRTVGQAITVTGYPESTVYRSPNYEYNDHEWTYTASPHYPESATPEERQPRTYANRRLLKATEHAIEVALWPPYASGPVEAAEKVAHHVVLPLDNILSIALAEDEYNEQNLHSKE